MHLLFLGLLIISFVTGNIIQGVSKVAKELGSNIIQDKYSVSKLAEYNQKHAPRTKFETEVRDGMKYLGPAGYIVNGAADLGEAAVYKTVITLLSPAQCQPVLPPMSNFKPYQPPNLSSEFSDKGSSPPMSNFPTN